MDNIKDIISASMPVTLRIGKHKYQCADLSHASLVYQIARDEADKGSSRWPSGVATLGGKVYRVSYNGRVWDGDVMILEAA